MLALFGAKDREALEARLVRGEGPLARRLQRLAATLPIGEPPRLEPMRVVVDRRMANVNLRCVRIAGPEGATWLLASVPVLGVATDEPPTPGAGAQSLAAGRHAGARFRRKTGAAIGERGAAEFTLPMDP